jgi:hypothetical protein
LKVSRANRHFELINDLLIWGWDGIASELNISPRTARYWAEKYGMPVRNCPSGRVFSIPGELKGWLYIYSEVLRGVPLEEACEKWRRAFFKIR